MRMGTIRPTCSATDAPRQSLALALHGDCLLAQLIHSREGSCHGRGGARRRGTWAAAHALERGAYLGHEALRGARPGQRVTQHPRSMAVVTRPRRLRLLTDEPGDPQLIDLVPAPQRPRQGLL